MRRVNPSPDRDWCKPDGAHALAQQIKLYWAARGKDIETFVWDEGGVHVVRSTLVFNAPTMEMLS